MPPKKAATTAAVVPKNITTAKLTAKEPATKRKAEEDIDEPTPKRGRNGKSQAATVTVTKKASKTTAKAKVTPKATPKAKPAARAATSKFSALLWLESISADTQSEEFSFPCYEYV